MLKTVRIGKFLFFIVLCLPLTSLSQNIWSEGFQYLEPGGALVPNGAAKDTGSSAWSTVQPSNSSMFFKYSFPGYDVFAIDQTSEEGEWRSEEISIAGYSEVAISVTLGSYWASSTDYIRCYYKLDGGEEVLFGEQFGKANLNVASVASAIVSGNTLQVIFKAYEHSEGTYGGFPKVMGVDDVTISRITYLYAIGSGNWDSTGIWSKEGYNGTSCACIPDENTHVFIRDKNVTLNAAGTTAGLTIEGSGKLNYTAHARLAIVRGGVLAIAPNAKIKKNEFVNASLSFPTYSYNVEVDGELSVENIIIDAANVNFSGNGSISVSNNVSVNNSRGNIIVNANENLTVGNSLNFPSSSSNVTFENEGNLTVTNRVFFDNDGVILKNSGTLNIGNSGILVNNADDDGNQLNNSGSFRVGAINLNGGDFTLNNTGSIDQTGSFSNITSGSAFYNLNGGTWNFSGTGINSRLFTNYAQNTFNYSASGNQNILVPKDGAYNNLTFSGSGVKTATGELTINGNLSLTGSAQLNPSAQANFVGGSEQTITTPAATVAFSTLTIDKTAGNVTLSSTDLSISNALNLRNGGLKLNGGTVYIANSSPLAIKRTNGFIKSETPSVPYSSIQWAIGTGVGEYVFPFGKTNVSGDYIPFTFQVTTPGAGAGTVTVATYGTAEDNMPYPDRVASLNNASGADNSSNVADRFWQIDLNGYATGPTATITFTATADEVGGISNLRAQHWNNDEVQWDAPIDGQVNPAPNAVTVPGVSSFSPWAMVGENSLLPITLIYFKGQLKDNSVILEWKTAQEVNNDYFTLEKTQDLKTFYEVKTVKGKGTSYKENSYQIIDPSPFAGRSYYRLKQTDFNGDFEYAKIIPITFEPPFSKIELYPNPFNGKALNITLTGRTGEETLPFEVFNANGQCIYAMVLEVSGKTKRTIIFDKALLPGLYLIKVGNHFKEKLVVGGE